MADEDTPSLGALLPDGSWVAVAKVVSLTEIPDGTLILMDNGHSLKIRVPTPRVADAIGWHSLGSVG